MKTKIKWLVGITGIALIAVVLYFAQNALQKGRFDYGGGSPDLLVENVSIEIRRSGYTASVRVKNIGSAVADATTVLVESLYGDDLSNLQGSGNDFATGTARIPALRPNQSSTVGINVELNYWWRCEVRNHYIRTIVNPVNRFRIERNGFNNSTVQRIGNQFDSPWRCSIPN